MATIRFRDTIHNFIAFEGKEVDLIDAPVLQRLRGIRQLAMASLVYPGALHTRFDHTLGVTHVAGQMADALGLDTEERRLVRFAALLHDIGHGPFSHVSENALERFANRTVLPAGQKKEKIHELITVHLIENDKRIRDILGGDDCKRVIKLLQEGYGDPVLRGIVSGPLDADKQDYLLRDSRFCGVDYGVFDIHQLQRSLVAEQHNHAQELMIRLDGVHAVEQFVLAKYYLTTMVYRHRVRLITDQMITRAITLGIEKDSIPTLQKLYEFDGSPTFIENYLGWNDSRFMMTFGHDAPDGSRCKLLLNRLNQRWLLKRVFHLPVKEFTAEARERLLDVGKPANNELRRKIELAVASVLKEEFNADVDADFVILHSYQIKSARESSRNDEASILVSRPGQIPSHLEKESTLFASIDERLSDQFVEVYAPVEWADHTDRDRRLARLAQPLKEAIQKNLPGIQQHFEL
ncbi:MAG: HD domain-containing protein [Verrucomicrobia bacterium]|nr:HD domain-containing protein [Verrucomicrobiota bacterium]